MSHFFSLLHNVTQPPILSKTQGSLFGGSFSLDAAGLGDLRGDTLVPGVAVFSRRALPLAAWTNGLEIAGGV